MASGLAATESITCCCGDAMAPLCRSTGRQGNAFERGRPLNCDAGRRGYRRWQHRRGSQRQLQHSNSFPSQLRVAAEQLLEMLIHGAGVSIMDGASVLEFGASSGKGRDCIRERIFSTRTIDGACAGNELVHRRAAVWDNQRESACPRFGGGHAERLGLATVNQTVAAGEQAGKFGPVGDSRQNRDMAQTYGKLLEPPPARPLAAETEAARR